MKKMPNVVVVMAYCSSSGESFGIRLEEVSTGKWAGDWAFAVKETKAEKEGYHKNTVTGEFTFSEEYPGCPYCGKTAAVYCNCETTSCWDGVSKEIKCPKCGRKGEVQGLVSKLRTGTDR